MAKVAGTAGLGYKVGAFAVNIAYAATLSISRTVTDGEIRPSNGAKEGRSVDGADKPLPPINNGEYRAFTHTISLSVEVNFDTLFRGSERKSSYGDPEVEVLASPSDRDRHEQPSSPPPPPKSDEEEEPFAKAADPPLRPAAHPIVEEAKVEPPAEKEEEKRLPSKRVKKSIPKKGMKKSARSS
jgi:hypothetical protein